MVKINGVWYKKRRVPAPFSNELDASYSDEELIAMFTEIVAKKSELSHKEKARVVLAFHKNYAINDLDDLGT